MARQESDREDLLREATALVERIEMDVGRDEPVVVGFRRDGSGSIYFGQDPVLQFNRALELRRAYRGGELWKAEQGTLVALTRERTAEAVLLVRRPLSGPDTQRWLAAARQQLEDLLRRLRTDDYRVVGQVPSTGELPQRVTHWLAALLERPLRIAARPGLGG